MVIALAIISDAINSEASALTYNEMLILSNPVNQ